MNRRLKLLICWSLVCFPILGWAQRPAADSGHSAIRGRVGDAQTLEPLSNVLVYLYKTDSSIAPRYLNTDASGAFLFEDLSAGYYSLGLSHVSYRQQSVGPITLAGTKGVVNLGLVSMQPSGTLAEVVVSESRPAMEFQGDTIALNLSRSMMGAGSSAADALRTMPMVQVDINGRPGIAGKANTRIFIDGKPSDFSAAAIADLLQVLPSDAIEKIEVITQPDPKYAADGDGIINITMKKGYRIGLTGAISATAGSLGNYQVNSYGSLRKKGFSLSGSYGFRDAQFKSASQINRQYYQDEQLSGQLEQFSAGANNNSGHSFRTTADWDIHSRHKLRLSGSVNQSASDSRTTQEEYRKRADLTPINNRFQSISNGQSGFNWMLDADYEWKPGRKNELLSAGLVWYDNRLDMERRLERSTEYPGQPPLPFSQDNRNDISNSRLEWQLDYKRPVGKTVTLSTGWQFWRAANGNEQLVTGYDYVGRQDTLLARLSRPFHFTEQVTAVYTSLNGRIRKKWNYRLGLRAEYTRVGFRDSALASLSPKPYHSLFPSFSFSRLFRKKLNLGFSYGRRISRPREQAINPLVDDINPSNIQFGNPGLRASYTDQFQLSVGYIAKTWTFTPRIEWAQTGRIIERFRISPDSVTYLNLASSRRFTIGLYGSWRPSKAITLTAGTSASHWDYQSNAAQVAPRSAWSYQVNGSLSAALSRQYFAEAQLNYQDNASSQGRSVGYLAMTAGLRKSFWKNKLQVRLLATDPLRQQVSQELTRASTGKTSYYVQELDRQRKTRNYSLGITYRFTKADRS